MKKEEDKTHKYAFWMAVFSLVSIVIVTLLETGPFNNEWWVLKVLNSTFAQTLVIALVGGGGFYGVVHQIKQADAHAERERKEREAINKQKVDNLRETLRKKAIFAVSIMDQIGYSHLSPTERLNKVKEIYDSNEIGQVDWEKTPKILPRMHPDDLKILSVISAVCTQIESSFINKSPTAKKLEFVKMRIRTLKNQCEELYEKLEPSPGK